MSNSDQSGVISLTKELVPRFILLEGSEADESQVRTFSFKHSPHFGLLCPSQGTLLLTGLSVAAFNPISLDCMKLIRKGDRIIVESSNTDPVYLVWDPPAEYQVEDNYKETFIATEVAKDSLGFPITVLNKEEQNVLH